MTLPPQDPPASSGKKPSGQDESDLIHIPEVLPAMLINDVIIFPNTIAPLVVSAEPIIKLVNDTLSGSKMMAAFARVPDPISENPEDQFYHIGSAVQILKMFRVPDGSLRLLVQGLVRVERTRIIETSPYLKVEIKPLRSGQRVSLEGEALVKRIVSDFTKLAESNQTVPEEVKIAVYNITDPGALADIVASNLSISLDQKQEILEAVALKERLGLVATQLARELKLIQLGSEIQTRVESEMAHGQREYFLREQMKAIRRELGEDIEGGAEIAEFEQQIKAANMPPVAEEAATKELERMKRMSSASAEYTVSRTYLEWLVALPWQKTTDEELDVERARKILDRDHYGLDDVKNRILEFLAVRKLRPTGKGPILCFIGPPGVGKTSLGKSIAVALNREFSRMSLGGVRDEAEIRGHRRTYVGALPGRIIQSVRRVGVKNPVIMLDEIDKLGADFRGDPASALLEVLDPAQNATFQDHYLDVEFDLSKVFFITTANDVNAIPGPLRDRMEIIEIPSYITPEKIQIAKHYLVPRQIDENGLTKTDVTFSDKGLSTIILGYTREAGVRKLEQQIASICRKIARKIVTGKRTRATVTDKTVYDYLGPAQYLEDTVKEVPGVGVALGLAWTPVGGDVLVIESTWMPGSKQLQVTGQLGDVMKESAQIALSYLRANSEKYHLDNDIIARHDIHIHVPAGATPKDGPSAGVTLTTSLASLFSTRPVRRDLGMTGEITLSGRVLPIGGLREKIVAASRHGLKTVIIPRANEKDLFFVPAHIRKTLQFKFVDTIDDVLNLALMSSPKKKVRTKS
ncbi:endopeptidase La [candidate division KSB1 bacterium]|nr:MAG: endopeptidase La [candidate division KSB1 bacterium]